MLVTSAVFSNRERLKMSRLVEWIDRLKLVEGVILIGAVLIGDHFYGILGIVTAVASALVLVVPYAWWRRKGLFRKRS